jgi:hypothetical protein
MEETSYEQINLRFTCRHGESKNFLDLHYNQVIDSLMLPMEDGDC